MNLSCLSPAKVNLYLAVTGRRADGFHELRTIFQTVDLCDRVDVSSRRRPGVELEVSGKAVPADASNLAWRAAEAYFRRWRPSGGVHLRLRKKIPVGGGLGGGSSNAATVLLALRRMFGEPRSRDELWPAARELGADVPYFLVGGTALGVGRGDELLPLPEMAPCRLLLATPAVEISTASIFSALGRLTAPARASSMESLLRAEQGWRFDRIDSRNDLEDVAFERHPVLRDVYNRLLESGAEMARLSGSGSTLIAYSQCADFENSVARGLPPGIEVVSATSLSRERLAARGMEAEKRGDGDNGDQGISG